MSGSQVKLEDVLGPVSGGLDRMRSIMLAQLTDHSASVRDMTDHISRFRGKQLRGALVLLAGEATGNTTDEHPQVAAIVEMIHLATLVHDDVLDGAEVRRRVACVNERWDNQVAILLGDFLYARAFALSTELSSRLASRVLSDTTRRLCVGEIDQSQRRYDFEMPQDVYEGIAGAKTATLYAAACELGARYPAGNEDAGREMRALGWEIGLCFQIIDDCLDVTGTQEEVGKSVGNDAEDGKVTLPVLHIYAHADEAQRAAIRDAYTAPGIVGRTARLREVADLAPGVDYAMARAKELIEQARRRIAALPPTPARTALDALTAFVLERSW